MANDQRTRGGGASETNENLPTASNPPQLLSRTERSRLATMPLAVLLPKLGTVSTLPAHASSLERRLQSMQESNQSNAEHHLGSDQREAEESMLSQVLQWVELGTRQ